ncbi:MULTISPECIES: hypothetical protein [Bacillus]|uniref:hypothetical protein n=1 Tax=Bacillus TaxID=1386 RepID=UPI000AF40776|nr:hypothetical protein [Bacillus cereus]
MALQWIQLNIERKKAARSYQLRTTCGCILSLPTIEYGFQYEPTGLNLCIHYIDYANILQVEFAAYTVY